MTAIVYNTMARGVTHYDWVFCAITATHAARHDGLYALGGDTDAGGDIEASFATPLQEHGATLKKTVQAVYLLMDGGAALGVGLVRTPAQQWTYLLQTLEPGVSRYVPGRGIRENALGFGFANTGGAAFEVFGLEALIAASATRRIG